MNIRKATKKDITGIAKLMREEFAKHPFNEKESLKSILKSLNFYLKIGKAFVILHHKEIVGVVIFKVEQYWEGRVMIIEDLAVKEEFKKQGLGKTLMIKVESYSKKNKIISIYFNTEKKSSAVKFYKKLGYKIATNRISLGKKISG
jgi:N-acetylglutamate synthase-like GNAT family acetyltransferase